MYFNVPFRNRYGEGIQILVFIFYAFYYLIPLLSLQVPEDEIATF